LTLFLFVNGACLYRKSSCDIELYATIAEKDVLHGAQLFEAVKSGDRR
jgi:hypothetical protein